MCYPCTGCNGCGKMDSELFSFMTPRLRCLQCGANYVLGQRHCVDCGLGLPRSPGESNNQAMEEEAVPPTTLFRT